MNNKRKYIIQCVETRQSGITLVNITTEYNLLLSFNSYPEISISELSGLSDIEYQTRLVDFIDYIGMIDQETKTELLNNSTIFDASCVTPIQVINVAFSCEYIPLCTYNGGSAIQVFLPPTTTTTTSTTTTTTTTELICPPFGELVDSYCNGLFQIDVYADGNCGTYNINTNISCSELIPV